MYAYPKHVRIDHPVLVYKTCEIEQTVLRLFSCLPPPLSPQSFTSLSYSLLYLKSSFGSVTSTTNTLSLLLAAYHKVVSLDRFTCVVGEMVDQRVNICASFFSTTIIPSAGLPTLGCWSFLSTQSQNITQFAHIVYLSPLPTVPPGFGLPFHHVPH